MHRRRKLHACFALLLLASIVYRPLAQAQTSYEATLAISVDQPRGIINRNIYGQFAEHLGRLIYEGIWVGENSSIPNTRGMRNDVLAALKELHVPVLRWPGGCFADEYHWLDGIGPRDKRPRRPNSSWGGVDTNAFGTHEFLELCEMLGATLVRTLRMDEFIQKHSAIMDKYDPQKRVGLMVDEWGTWYDSEPGRDLGALYQQNTLRDAVAAAINLNIFHKHADRVKIANIAQMINVLQAMILTDKRMMVLTPTYHVFRMYSVHQGATLIPVDLRAPEYRLGDASVPSLSASASRDTEGRLHLSVVNLDPNRAAEITATISGEAGRNVTGEVLTAPVMNAMNTFDQPNTIKPAPFRGYKLDGSRLSLTIPAKSIVVIELK